MRTRRFSNSVTLSLALCFLMVLLTQSSLAGTYCGSDATPLAKLFKETSSDWWPDVGLLDIYSAGKTIGGYADLADYLRIVGKACVVYGQAYLGEACWAHDACYAGKIMPGADRRQCDERLKQMWRDACAAQYPNPDQVCILGVCFDNPLQSLRPGCREACQITTDFMAHIQSTVFAGEANDAWDAARPEREANLGNAFIQKQCLEMTPPGGTCVIPAGDYPVVLTIDQPVELESAGGLVRLGVID